MLPLALMESADRYLNNSAGFDAPLSTEDLTDPGLTCLAITV